MLSENDLIKSGVTAQIKINGADYWVRCDIESKLQYGESADDAWERVNAEVQKRLTAAIENVASTIQKFEKRR